MENAPFVIDVGDLRSIFDFQRHVTPSLRELGEILRARMGDALDAGDTGTGVYVSEGGVADHPGVGVASHGQPDCLEVLWDLREIEYGRRGITGRPPFSIAGLAALVATALTVRKTLVRHEGVQPSSKVRWNKSLQAFWNEIRFFEVVADSGCFLFPSGMIGGFSGEQALASKSTRLIWCPRPAYVPPIGLDNILEWTKWKDDTRASIAEMIGQPIADLYGLSFSEIESWGNSLESNVLTATTELVLNSWVWGESDAVLGLQRAYSRSQDRDRVTVAVCDGGMGFVRAMSKDRRERPVRGLPPTPPDAVDALAIACMRNKSRNGLRGVITDVINTNGWVKLFSDSGEMSIERPLWERVLEELGRLKMRSSRDAPVRSEIDDDALELENMKILRSLLRVFPEPVSFVEKQDLASGYRRVHKKSRLFGSRIVFEMYVGVNDG